LRGVSDQLLSWVCDWLRQLLAAMSSSPNVTLRSQTNSFTQPVTQQLVCLQSRVPLVLHQSNVRGAAPRFYCFRNQLINANNQL